MDVGYRNISMIIFPRAGFYTRPRIKYGMTQFYHGDCCLYRTGQMLRNDRLKTLRL